MRKAMNSWMRLLTDALNKEISASQKENNLPQSLSRRKFLSQTTQAALAAGIALSLPSVLFSCKKTETPADKDLLDVAILGGGIAGLSCANQLLGSGLSFRVLEASQRFGGRILTHYNDSLQLGIFPEFGGDFIDSDHQDMLDLAKEFKLELVDLLAEQQSKNWIKDIYFFDNRRIEEEEIIREFRKIAGKVAKDVFSLGENYDTPAAKALDLLPLSQYIRSLDCASWLKELLQAAFVAEYGLDCEEQSTLNMLSLIDTDTSSGFKVFGSSDERFRIKGGNSQIIQKLVEKIGEEHLLTNHELTSVKENNGIYSLYFKNGKIIRSRTVVCTIPFSILRDIPLELQHFSPEKRKCIQELGYGNNTKLILGYEGEPWRNEQNHAMGYLFSKDMTNGWDGSLNRTKDNPHGAYVAYFGGKLSQDLCHESFKNPLAPPSHIWRTSLPEERVKSFVKELEQVFPGSALKFKNRHVFVNWIEYPYVKASYTCYKPGQWTGFAGLEMQPVGNFFFAGEHCSSDFQGFMNGAAETGRRVGVEIRKTYQWVQVKTGEA